MPREPVKKLFKIGEVADIGGVSRQTVNYYTNLGILPEADRTPAGHRRYDESVFDRIDRIRQLKADHTLRQIADILRAEGQSRGEQKADNGKND